MRLSSFESRPHLSFVLCANLFGPDHHLFGVLAPANVPLQGGILFKAHSNIRMLGPEGFFRDFKRTLVEWLGLSIAALAGGELITGIGPKEWTVG